MLRAAPKNRFGRCNAFASTPPVNTFPDDGTTVSYAAFAAAAGHPKAARAAGTACATNPVPIIYPCHRVLRTDGQLGNYGGGSHLPPTHQDNLQRKAFLISHETQQLSQYPPDNV